MHERTHREEKNIVQQLNEYGMPVFAVDELVKKLVEEPRPSEHPRSKQEIAIEKAYWTGMQRAATIFITYGSTPERAVQMRVQADNHLRDLKQELNGEKQNDGRK